MKIGRDLRGGAGANSGELRANGAFGNFTIGGSLVGGSAASDSGEIFAQTGMGALKIGGAEVQLHADHAYDAHPWYPRLADGEARGLGAELRLLGLDPDRVEKRARESGGAIVRAATTKGHGWREVIVEDPDGYVWAIGVLTDKETAS